MFYSFKPMIRNISSDGGAANAGASRQSRIAASTQRREAAARQGRNQRRIGRKRTHRSQRKNDISPYLCDLCVPLRQKFCCNCMILGYSTAKAQSISAFCFPNFCFSLCVSASLRLCVEKAGLHAAKFAQQCQPVRSSPVKPSQTQSNPVKPKPKLWLIMVN